MRSLLLFLGLSTYYNCLITALTGFWEVRAVCFMEMWGLSPPLECYRDLNNPEVASFSSTTSPLTRRSVSARYQNLCELLRRSPGR